MSGLMPLLRQRMRRDWKQLLMWVVGTALLAYASYTGVSQSYGSLEDRQALLVTVMANPVILLFRGLPSGAEQGALMVFLIFPWLAMLAAFMSTFLAVRHTRMDEEQGRAELVSSTPAGRTTPVVATALHGLIANFVLAALTTLAFIGTGAGVEGAKVAASQPCKVAIARASWRVPGGSTSAAGPPVVSCVQDGRQQLAWRIPRYRAEVKSITGCWSPNPIRITAVVVERLDGCAAAATAGGSCRPEDAPSL